MEKILVWTTVIVAMVFTVRFFKRNRKNCTGCPALQKCSQKLARPEKEGR